MASGAWALRAGVMYFGRSRLPVVRLVAAAVKDERRVVLLRESAQGVCWPV